MRLVTYLDESARPRVGALVEGDTSVIDLRAGAEQLGVEPAEVFESMLALIEAGGAALEAAGDIVAAAASGRISAAVARRPGDLLAPVPVPPQMRDCLSFEKHFRQAREGRLRALAARAADPEAEAARLRATGQFEIPKVWYELPLYYKSNRFSVVGHETEVQWPAYCKLFDYELEFGIFIGGAAKNVPADAARQHIFGYTMFNDFTARDAQSAEMAGGLGPAKGKDFDTGNVLGPCIVTADEIPDPYDLRMEVRVNGEVRGRGNTGEMHHRFEDIIARVTADETLYPGEFIGSGTVGDGAGVEHSRFLSDGDVVELEVERIGTLRNRVVRRASRQ